MQILRKIKQCNFIWVNHIIHIDKPIYFQVPYEYNVFEKKNSVYVLNPPLNPIIDSINSCSFDTHLLSPTAPVIGWNKSRDLLLPIAVAVWKRKKNRIKLHVERVGLLCINSFDAEKPNVGFWILGSRSM